MNFDWLNQIVPVLKCGVDFFIKFGEWLLSIVPTINAIGTSLIAYYTFRLTIFPKKLKFINIKRSASAFDGDSLEITLENRSLCPVVIESVDLIIGTKKVQFFRGECIVDGFKTAKIEMSRYSQIVSNGVPIAIDIFSMGNLSLLVKTTRGIQHIKYETISKLAYRRIQKLEEKYERTTVCRNYYGDKLVVPGVRYALSYIDNQGNKQIVFIYNSGVMSASPFGYNGLPHEVMQNETTIRNHFDSEFKKHNLSYHLEIFPKPPKIEESINLSINERKETDDTIKKRRFAISATTLLLIFLFTFSLSLTWDIVRFIQPSHQYYRFFPLIQSLFLAGFTWMGIATTNDIQIFNDLIESKPKRKNIIGQISHFCAGIFVYLPTFIMWLIDVIFNRGNSYERKSYWKNAKQKLNAFDAKPLIVKTFTIPAIIMLVFDILITCRIFPENWIPFTQNIIDALVSSVGLIFILVNAKEKGKKTNTTK